MKRSIRVGLAALLLVVLALAQTSPLVVGFAMRPMLPRVGDLVKFTDLSAGAPVSWAWDFGDGGSSTLQNPTHVYNTAGSFTITLTVSDGATTLSITRRP